MNCWIDWVGLQSGGQGPNCRLLKIERNVDVGWIYLADAFLSVSNSCA